MSDEAPATESGYGLASLKGILPSVLAAGAGGGLLSGYMANRTEERPGEDADERRKRIIRSALSGALMTGGATGLGQVAYRNITTGAPPMSETAEKYFGGGSPWTLPLGLGGGAAGLGLATGAGLAEAQSGKSLWKARMKGGLKGGVKGGIGGLIAGLAAPMAYHIFGSSAQN